MLPSPVVEASNDVALRGAPLAVYVWLVGNHLDNVEARAVKIAGLAATLRIKPHTATRALKLLTERGYLDRRYVEREGYVYRAFLTRRLPLLPPNGSTHNASP